MDQLARMGSKREPWNKGKLVGQKSPLRLKDIWAIRIRLQLGERLRELALFNLALSRSPVSGHWTPDNAVTLL
jgi:hypothetical protein